MMYADLRTGPHGRIHHKTEVRSERKARVDGQEEQERCRISVPLVSTSDRQNWASHERRAVDEAVGETENENDGNAEQIGLSVYVYSKITTVHLISNLHFHIWFQKFWKIWVQIIFVMINKILMNIELCRIVWYF